MLHHAIGMYVVLLAQKMPTQVLGALLSFRPVLGQQIRGISGLWAWQRSRSTLPGISSGFVHAICGCFLNTEELGHELCRSLVKLA